MADNEFSEAGGAAEHAAASRRAVLISCAEAEVVRAANRSLREAESAAAAETMVNLFEELAVLMWFKVAFVALAQPFLGVPSYSSHCGSRWPDVALAQPCSGEVWGRC